MQRRNGWWRVEELAIFAKAFKLGLKLDFFIANFERTSIFEAFYQKLSPSGSNLSDLTPINLQTNADHTRIPLITFIENIRNYQGYQHFLDSPRRYRSFPTGTTRESNCEVYMHRRMLMMSFSLTERVKVLFIPLRTATSTWSNSSSDTSEGHSEEILSEIVR